MPARKDVPQGTLDLLILRIIAREPRHGWGIMQRLRQLTNDVFQVTPGSLFPALQRASVIAAVAFANAITLRPFPAVREQHELVEIRIEQCFHSRSGCIPMDTRHEDYLALREATTGLQGIAASPPTPVAAALPDAHPLSASLVSANHFDVLGTVAAVGRTFAPAEANIDRAGVAVIAHRLWLREFAADPAVLGRAIRIAGPGRRHCRRGARRICGGRLTGWPLRTRRLDPDAARGPRRQLHVELR